MRRHARKIGSPAFCLRSRTRHILSALALLVLVGCDPTKRIGEGQYLLKQNRVLVDGHGPDPDDLNSIVKQKPNKRILGIPIYLGIYNLSDQEALHRKRAQKDSVCVQHNIERVKAGRRERTCDRSTRERTGEPPVILDTALTARSTEQIRLYMHKEGWFNAQVRDTTHFNRRKLSARIFSGTYSSARGKAYKQPKAEVAYHIIPGPAYHLRHISFRVDDPSIQHYVQQHWEQSLLRTGDRYDADVLDEERVRITDDLKEEGYLFFVKDLVLYRADTTVGDHQVDITLIMERPYAKSGRGLKGTPEGTIYTIENVTIVSGGPATLGEVDTTDHAGYQIIHRGPLMYRPKPLIGSIFIEPGDRFQQSMGDKTYRRLSGLRVFDRVEMTYDTSGTGKPGVANARIGLLPGKPQSMTNEVYTTNRGGFLGLSVSVGYRHRNVFRSLGFIQTQLNAAVEAQQTFTRNEVEGQVDQVLNKNTFFNTISIGPEVTMGFPLSRYFSKSSGSRLLINSLFNYQRRPDFTRTLAKGSVGLEWNESATRTIGLYADLNAIKIPSKSTAFEHFLTRTNDPVFTNSYTNHLIFNIPRATFTWNTQGTKRTRNVFYLRSTAELAGTVVRFIQSAANNNEFFTDTTTGREYRTLLGVRYSEYFKVDNDFRINHTIHDRSSVAFRFAAGMGMPYKNLEVLPFESSFFGGGANGMRAWRARSLGPGSYSAPLLAYDRLGEIRIEANFEYRFKLIGYLEGALFTDVGNIWNRRKDPRRPGAEFELKDFMSELAVGTGVGARLNFEFFIIRFDLGMQTKDPSLPKGERWIFQAKDRYEEQQAALGVLLNYRTQFNFNLGIGYPF
jgi:outer membrane protein assembly factor BamA